MNRRKKFRWWAPLLLMCLSATFVVIGISTFHGFKFRQPEKKPVWVDLSQEEDSLDASSEKNGKWYGLCKKNSINSIADFRKAVVEDDTLRVHFADFRWNEATIEKTDKPIYAYVYFRKDGRLFQKIQPIKLPAGDQFITDGKIRVRTHCCNNYEEAPPPLVESMLEPAPESGEESLPLAPKLALLPTNSESTLPSFISTPKPSSSGGVASPFTPVIIANNEQDDNPPGTPVAPPTPPPPTPISEPISGLFLVLGIFTMVLALVTWRYKKHTKGIE
jgi:hypothetical protein